MSIGGRDLRRGRDGLAAILLTLLSTAHTPGAPSLQAPVPAAPAAPSEDIRDIRGPRADAPPWFWWTATGAVLMVVAGYGLWWRHRRRHAPVVSPYDAALQRLEASRALMQPASAREFAAAVTGIVRAYIEQRFSVRISHRTTEEFLRDLLQSSDAALARHRPRLADFLHHCDFVKFADATPPQQSLEFLHASACRFVREAHDPLPAA